MSLTLSLKINRCYPGLTQNTPISFFPPDSSIFIPLLQFKYSRGARQSFRFLIL